MTDDRIPPHDINAEQVALGAMMLAENVIVPVFDLLGEAEPWQPGARKPGLNDKLYRPAHKMIYAAIMAVANRGQAPDAVLVNAELQTRGWSGRTGHGKYLHELIAAVPVTANAAHYAEIVVARYRDRRADELLDSAAGASPDHLRALVETWLIEDQSTRDVQSISAPSWTSRLKAGGGFVLDAPALPPVMWGDGEQIAWADGEALMLCGPPGVGKTTLVQQLVEARLGISKEVLGMAVQAGRKRVLYLAMDRPPQIARAMARLFGADHRDVLDEGLIVWQGPPPHDLARHPDLLAEMCEQAGADTVIVDSLKDAVLKLSDDESGSGYNRARQKALVEGVQVVELHHQRKAGGENKKPSKLDDVYGSVWLTAGAGSVILLWGEPGDPVVELLHLKQPLEPVGPFQVQHDHTTGRSSVYHRADLLQMAQEWSPTGARGITAPDAARALFDVAKPKPADVERARRKLEALRKSGHLVKVDGSGGGDNGGTPTKYYRAPQGRP
ncbi:DnaB-like helicase N-terminal domain-containing protein [Actinocorallia longicatena]|uniref:AAA+ ATPase domain-containing protein n=1 Tax=Actinocorallia longicatena TaxID=111803 RepID=A0ABP6QAN7_9ACTN